jgi:rubredoxin
MPWKVPNRPYYYQECHLCKWEYGWHKGDRREQYAEKALQDHIAEHHKCHFCNFVPKYKHTFDCKGKRLYWRNVLDHHEAQHEKAARALKNKQDKMMVICLAEDSAPISALTDDLLYMIFLSFKLKMKQRSV